MPNPVLVSLLRWLSTRDAANAAVGDALEELADLTAADRRPVFPNLWTNLQVARTIGRTTVATTPRLVRSARLDFRLAVRSLRAAPIVSTVAILTLALGIGANTAVFSLVNALLLRSVPIRHPEQMVVIADPSRGVNLPPTSRNQLTYMWSFPMWAQIRQRPALFENAFGYFYSRFNLASGGQTEFVDGLYASGRFFETMGVGTILGRTFSDADDQRNGGSSGAVAVISYPYAALALILACIGPVSLTFASWNQIASLLRGIDRLRVAA